MYYNPDMVLDAGGTFSLVWCCSMIALDDDLMDAMHLHSSRTIPSLVPLYCIYWPAAMCALGTMQTLTQTIYVLFLLFAVIEIIAMVGNRFIITTSYSNCPYLNE